MTGVESRGTGSAGNDSSEDTTPRSSSQTTARSAGSSEDGEELAPPRPPPDFNPPADFPIDSPASSISTPSIGSIASPPSRAGSGTWWPPLEAGPGGMASPTFPGPLQRPTLQSLQRVSAESIPTPGSSSSISSNQSESGEHLAEMREGLKEKLLQHSEGSTPARERSESLSEPFRFNIYNPTPPSEAIDESSDEEHTLLEAEDAAENHAGPSRSRRLSSGALAILDQANELPAEHAWDSVWPAPGSAHRSVPPEPGPSRFPIAPVSPFVTPAFSPAIITTGSSSLIRKPTSPTVGPYDPASPSRRSWSPPPSGSSTGPGTHRFSPRVGATSPSTDHVGQYEPGFGAGRRRSVTAEIPGHSPPSGSMPISINLNRHSRTLSSSSQGNSPQSRTSFDKLQRGSPIGTSPPRSPKRPPLPMAADAGLGTAPSPPPSRSLGHNPSGSIGSVPVRPPNPPSPAPPSALATSRPRGKSMSAARPSLSFGQEGPFVPSDLRRGSPSVRAADVGRSKRGSASSLEDGSVSPLGSSASLPPIALPPAIAEAPTQFPIASPANLVPGLLPPSPPLYAPLARPAVLRRALSDYDAKAMRHSPSSFHRPLMSTSELEKSPKRTPADAELTSPATPEAGADSDRARVKKSPKSSNSTLPHTSLIPPLPSGPLADAEARVGDLATRSGGNEPSYFPEQPWPAGGSGTANHVGDVELVDEGDVLPSGEVQMDVTFDDEGLNTLERIFLLSKSEYPFHRAYVARVLGDLLNEVDPCESVEYVLPLLSGFSMDEDESVKEAFASELHRILWYFYSTCKLLVDDGTGEMVELPELPRGREHESLGAEAAQTDPSSADQGARGQTVTVTSEGVNVVDRPTMAEADEAATPMARRVSNTSLLGTGTLSSSVGSSSIMASSSAKPSPDISDGMDVDTPNSSISAYSASSQDTAYSPGLLIKPHTDDYDAEELGYTKDQGILVDRPILAVNFFTPLIGSLMLNQNPTISESVRNGVVAVLGRLRGKGDMSLETWGHAAFQQEPDERRGYATQNGPHQHDLRPFTAENKAVVEHELLQGIIIGMGQLSTEIPDTIFDDPETAEDEIRDREAFQAQLIQEATAGRATTMNLIGAVCEFFEDEEVVENGFVHEVLAAGDGDVPVRAEAAVAMSYLAKMVPVEYIYQMLPLFEAFCEDENEHVRQSACLSLPPLCKRIESADYRRSFAVKAVQTLISGSEDVRCAALEMLGEVIHIFHGDSRGPPEELLDVYTDDAEVGEHERDSDWDVVAIFNLPGVCLTLGPDRWSEIRDLFQRLQERAGEKVLRTTASCLHELAKILSPEQVASDLLPVYTQLLGGTEDIRERVFDHVDVIIDSVPKDVGWRLFRHLAQGWRAGMLGGWRAREKLALHIPSFLKTFKGRKGIEEVLEMMRDALLDPFAAVRDAATKGIPDAYEVLGTQSAVAKRFRDILLDLGDSKAFKRRLTFVRCLREFVKPPPNRTAFEDFFLPVLPRLAKDVVDVRLGLAQIIADLFVVGAYYAGVDHHVPKMIWDLARRLADDEAVDVRDTVRKVDMDRAIQEGKGKDVQVPYEIKTGNKPDRAMRPGDRSTNLNKAPVEGSSFPSVSVSAASAGSASLNRSTSRSSSRSSAGPSPLLESSSATSLSSSEPSPGSDVLASIRPRDRTKDHDQDPTPTQRSPDLDKRRASGGVSAKMGSMYLSAGPTGDEDADRTPRVELERKDYVGSPRSSPTPIQQSTGTQEGEAVAAGSGEGTDPFALSFGVKAEENEAVEG
ncbi:hypothetical protein IAU60_002708 [Kwoniella sp. DSM 27419]